MVTNPACSAILVSCWNTHAPNQTRTLDNVLPGVYPRLLFLKCRVECDRRWGEIGATHECQRVGRAPLAFHPRVLPFNREGTLVADAVEGAEDRFEIHITVS